MKKYESYKESGIEWIGEIPNHWKSTKVKFEILSKGYKAGPFGSSLITSELLLNGTIKVYSPEHVAEKEILEEWYLPDDRAQEMSQFIVNDKDVVLPIVGTLGLARVFHSNRDGIGIINQRLAKISCNSNRLVPEFFCLIMKDVSNYQEYFKLKARGSILSHLNKETIVSMPLVLPDIEEQELIINYLDYKTAQIDHLITKKEQFIQLLEEERVAVINQAVTKGLDLTVSMKDTGIEWLGEIPEHWECKRIGHVSKVIRGASPRPAGDPLLFNGDFLPWITVKEVTNAVGKFITSTESFLTELGSKQTRILEPETLILSNSGATLGVPRITSIQGGINDGSVAFLSLEVERDYLYYFFVTHTNIYREEAAGYGQPNLNTDIVKSTKIPVPPINEQIKIVSQIEVEINRFNKLLKVSANEIELLKEYKTALISDVVTGKVDVSTSSTQVLESKN